jgi:hypothetical protein
VSDWPFSKKAALLFIISALLLPCVLLTRDFISAGLFMAFFVIVQAAILFFFYREEQGLDAWYSFIAALAGLVFTLAIVLKGRSLYMEYAGFLLFIGYLVGALIFLLRGGNLFASIKHSQERRREEHGRGEISDDDIESFRKKDDLDNLVKEFQIQPPPKKDIGNFDDIGEAFANPKPKIANEEEWNELGAEEGPLLDEKEELAKDEKNEDEVKEAGEDAEEDYFTNILKKREEITRKPDLAPRFSDYFQKEHSYSEEGPVTGDFDDEPNVDFDKVKSDLEKIDSGVKTISEKIKEISEKAIKEGEEKKKKAVEEKKKTETDKRVFASNNGTKYHNDRNCVTLKRVSKKNMVTFTDSNEARKRGLKACGLCKR